LTGDQGCQVVENAFPVIPDHGTAEAKEVDYEVFVMGGVKTVLLFLASTSILTRWGKIHSSSSSGFGGISISLTAMSTISLPAF
jgi:hypothetical protein